MSDLAITNSFDAGDAIVASEMNTNFGNITTWANNAPNIGASGQTATMDGALTVTEALIASSTSQFNGTVTVGVNEAGYDVKLFGATSGTYLLWDEDQDELTFVAADLDMDDASVIRLGTGDDLLVYSNGSHSFIDHDGDGNLYIRARGTDEDMYIDAKDNLNLQTDSATHLTITAGGVVSVNPSGSYPVVIGVGNRSTPNGNNLAVGTGALAAVTGGDNLAIGYNAMNATTTSGWNTAIGHGAMALQTTQSGAPSYAQYSTAVGYESLYNMVNGSGGNVGLGFKAGRGITTGVNNVYIGMQCGDTGIGGHTNTSIGYNTTRNISTGYYNVALGAHAGIAITEGYNNDFIGYLAGQSNTTGDDNIAIGTQALYTAITADDNVAIGFQSLFYATNITNVGVGSYAGHWITTGHSNTMIGYYAGAGHPTTGDNNTALGNAATPLAADSDNSVTLGNSSIASLRCQVQTISALSDERDKTDIEDFDMGLDFVRRLRPRRFVWNMRDGGKVGIEETGFVAQELQQAQADEGKTIPSLILDENPDKLEAAMGALLPSLVLAVQELAEKVEAMA